MRTVGTSTAASAATFESESLTSDIFFEPLAESITKLLLRLSQILDSNQMVKVIYVAPVALTFGGPGVHLGSRKKIIDFLKSG